MDYGLGRERGERPRLVTGCQEVGYKPETIIESAVTQLAGPCSTRIFSCGLGDGQLVLVQINGMRLDTGAL